MPSDGPDAPLVLRGRRHTAEWMDDPSVDYATFRGCLKSLEWVNRLSLGYRPTVAFVARAAAGRRQLSVLDVGSGHGDTLRALLAWGDKHGVALDLTGVDINPHAARAAAEADASAGVAGRIRHVTADVFDHAPATEPDLIVSALFTHHLGDAALTRFLALSDEAARLGWFVNDLHRHPVSYYGLSVLFSLFPVHPFVRHDGPVSVRRAMTGDEWRVAVDAAGVRRRVAIDWWFPFRWGVAALGQRP